MFVYPLAVSVSQVLLFCGGILRDNDYWKPIQNNTTTIFINKTFYIFQKCFSNKSFKP